MSDEVQQGHKPEHLSMDDYQEEAWRTMHHDVDDEKALAILALGVAGEAGEVADYVKKVIGHGHPMDKDKLRKEIGDALWYLAAISKQLGMTLSEVAWANIEKLRARYPNGFEQERSLNRVEEVES